MSNLFRPYILLYLCTCFLTTNAQGTFILKIRAEQTEDIQEDEKGGIWVTVDNVLVHYSGYGELISFKEVSSYGRLKYSKKLKSIFYIGAGDGSSIEIRGFNLRSEQLFVNLQDPMPEDTSQLIWDFVDDTARNQIVTCGWQLKRNERIVQYWIAGFDYGGKLLWQKAFYDKAENRYFRRIFKNGSTGGYFLVSNDIDRSTRHELFSTDSLGNVLIRAPIEPNPDTSKSWPYNLYDGYYDYQLTAEYATGANIVLLNDTTLIASVEQPDRSFHFYKYNLNLTVRSRILGGARIFQYKKGYFLGLGGTGFWIYNDTCKMIFSNDNIYSNKETEFVYIKKLYPSKDGGFYGIAEGEIAAKGLSDPYRERWVYIFKTDSLGRINNTIEYVEKTKPMMLQPNPADNRVRILIPYYFGNIEASFYTLQGQKILTQTQNEANYFDIRSLSPGIYVVHAKILETGEVRKMKLVVQ